MLKISNLYVKTLTAVALFAGTMYAVTKAADMLSAADTQTVLLGGMIFITAIFAGGWSIAKIILAKSEVHDESTDGRSSGSGPDHTAG